MRTYVIPRRDGWRTGDERQSAAARATAVGDEEMPADIRWMGNHLLAGEGGALGAVGGHQASSPAAIRGHAEHAGLPGAEIIEVADAVVVHPDPDGAA